MKLDTPLSQVRVLNIGIGWAGRVASMLLAEQGADVIEIIRPGRRSHPADVVLDRSKRLVELNIKKSGHLEKVLDLAKSSNIIIENMRPGVVERLGVGYRQLGGDESGLVYLSLPGFAAGDPRRDDAAWEGSIAGATGVYSDLSPLGRLIGGAPVFTCIPMASAYGGILGAATASLGYFGYQNSGLGQRFEVPLADAVMSAMALLIAELDGAPEHYDFPALDRSVSKVMLPILRDVRESLSGDHISKIQEYLRANARPGFNTYKCKDGRALFVCASDHVAHTRSFLETVGVYDQLISEGMTAESPFNESKTGTNINSAHSMSEFWRDRMVQLLSSKILQKSAKEWESALRGANVPATTVQTTCEWLQDSILLDSGVTMDLEDSEFGVVRQPARYITIQGGGVCSQGVKARIKEGENIDWKGEKVLPLITSCGLKKEPLLKGVKVLDFSNIIAGPAGGRTLAEFGADVTRIDSPTPLAGPFATMWFGVDVNQGKRAIILDLKTKDGRRALSSLVAQADIVLHNFLDSSAERMGISHKQLQKINPEIISCQISAWGGTKGGKYKEDPSFDPVLQAASGIMTRYGSAEKPVLHGIASCVDYMTGFLAVTGILQALVARKRGFGGSFVRTSLAMGAQLVQFPFMLSHSSFKPGSEPSGQSSIGHGLGQQLYKLADGWAYLGCRPEDEANLASLLGASECTVDAISTVVRDVRFEKIQSQVKELRGASLTRPESLATIRSERTRDEGNRESNWMNSGSFRLKKGVHPSGYMATICEPTWIRPDRSPISDLAPAPFPGQHTREILGELKFQKGAEKEFIDKGAAREGWDVLKHYLPL